MERCTLSAPAKINLYLEIIGDRPDGYHELAMIMQSVALCDRLQVRANGVEPFRLRCDAPGVPSDRSNLALRAAELMAQTYPDTYHTLGGVDIHLDKVIPIAAGLAGGSTDAAAVLVGLDLLWKQGLTQPELWDLGAELGSDVPFCISGGTALASGRGEEITPLPSMEGVSVVLAKYHSLAISTPWAYKTFRERFSHTYATGDDAQAQRRDSLHAGPMMSALLNRDKREIGRLLYNDLEKVVLPEFPSVANLRQVMSQGDVLGAMMSGSGPTVFALTETPEQAQALCDQVRREIPDEDLGLWVTEFCPTGIVAS
ncbi:4-(cytidine 5'-diphospho)-2-C-methyl-D-erythritol kinase [Sodalinema gerasimenkoae]|uniref:4-(cytidine 5'-diphospho)-2-C-methyl-D-erythritol kinase n=1 Tax=Sodalinema gerasimenkoae TaxID=2862348 RepID=UPI00135C38BC|nr:4-(cytidine 5'-diphospho)-2-C-methyl-D-erythritol kinase [Sodalinema gerasimenkoae]